MAETINERTIKENLLEEKQAHLQQLRENAYDAETQRAIDREIYDLEHPGRTRLKRRSRQIAGGVKQQTANAWGNTKTVAHTVAKSRGPARVMARPAGVHMRGPPAPAKRLREISSKSDIVTPSSERNFFGNNTSQGPSISDRLAMEYSNTGNPNSISDPSNLINIGSKPNQKKETRLY